MLTCSNIDQKPPRGYAPGTHDARAVAGVGSRSQVPGCPLAGARGLWANAPHATGLGAHLVSVGRALTCESTRTTVASAPLPVAAHLPPHPTTLSEG